MTKPLRLPTAAPPSRRSFAQGLPKTEERPSELLDPEVLERYLLLLSLEVESQRIIEENRRAMEEIDRARDEANARIKAASQG
ncbi:MAG: hypothetical protein JSR86_01300 [Proteobacteria bacterium]|nr:hypothetical protein [Pseudomonadota bacterium]